MKPHEITGSSSFRALNAAFFNSVAAGQARVAQPAEGRQSEDRQLARPAPGVGFRVCLIQRRRKLLDAHDNLPASCKPLVDAITAWLGFAADSDPALCWEYGQCQTTGQEGVIVHIETY